MNRIPVIVTCLVLALTACGAPKRAVKTEQELLARRAQVQMFAGAMKAGIMESLCRHAHKEREADPNFSLDILVLSGGGDFGADQRQPVAVFLPGAAEELADLVTGGVEHRRFRRAG